MKKIIFLISILYFITTACSNESNSNDIIELPIEIVPGYYPYNLSLTFMYLEHAPLDSLDSPWKKVEVTVTGIPADWKEPVVNQIELDYKQFVFQNFKQGNFDTSFYNNIKNYAKIDAITSNLSSTPIKSFTHIVTTRLDTGKVLYKIDTDNDRDFSDEKVYELIDRYNNLDLADSLMVHNPHIIEGEFLVDEKIKKVQYRLFVAKGITEDNFSYTFPQYARTQFLGESLAISSGFTYPSFRMNSDIMILDTTNLLNNRGVIEKGEFIKIKGQTFQNLGVNYGKQILKLKKIAKDSVLTSTQVGFNAIPFEGKEFTTGNTIRLKDFRGKFLYVEFWGTWCGPCIQEIPNMKDAYENLDKSKIEFLGIVARDKPETLRKFLTQSEIPWPQLLSDEQNDIVDLYNVQRFPSSFLIDDKGQIVAKDLRGERLVSRINYLMNKSK